MECRDTRPSISIGCAWYLAAGSHEVKLADDDISCNVMLLDNKGCDVGEIYSRKLILRWLRSDARDQDFKTAVLLETGLVKPNS